MKANSYQKKIDHSVFKEFREKRLDKVVDLMYTTYRGYRGKMKDFEKVDNRFNKNGNVEGSLETLKWLDEVVKEAGVKAGLGGTPIIAGGAIRDVALGYVPRDYDVFLLGMENSDQGQDDVAYFLSKLMEDKRLELTGDWKSTQKYQQDESKVVDVYQASFRTDIIDLRRPLDIVGRIEGTPAELIDDFDHDLVRCYYDDGLILHPAMIEALTKNRVASRDVKSHDRLYHWRNRTGHKITIGRPPKEKVLTGMGLTQKIYGDQKLFYRNIQPPPIGRPINVDEAQPIDLHNAVDRWFVDNEIGRPDPRPDLNF